jgi:predicted type IV restriction endonuclease
MPIDVRRPLKKLIPVLRQARQENLNEANTVQRLIMVFQEVLGYDPLTEIVRELEIKDKYVDLALRIDGVVKIYVEAKSAASELRDRYIDQAKGYAALSNIRWVVLTNGLVWNLYHLSVSEDEGLDYERVFSVDLSVEDLDLDKCADSLALLHRNNVRKGEHEEFWKKCAALDAHSLGRALYTESVLSLVRREIRKSEGILVDEEDLAAAIHDMLSPEAREKIGPVRIRHRRTSKAVKKDRSDQTQCQDPTNLGATGNESPLADNHGSSQNETAQLVGAATLTNEFVE